MLHYAIRGYIASKCDAKTVAALIEAGAHVLFVDSNKETALHILVSEGLKLDHERQEKAKSLIKHLLARGGQQYAYKKNKKDETVFDYADQNPQEPISKLLQLKRTLDEQKESTANSHKKSHKLSIPVVAFPENVGFQVGY